VWIPQTYLGRNLWRLRDWWNWSQQRLATEAKVPVSLVRQLERDKGNPTLSQLRAIASALQVQAGFLLLPGADVIRVTRDTGERLKKKYREERPDVCWLWIGAKRASKGYYSTTGKHYGLYQMDGKRESAHRLVYAMTKPLMENWDLDHTCKTRLCVNPRHLETVTLGTNLYRRDRRGWSKQINTDGPWKKVLTTIPSSR